MLTIDECLADVENKLSGLKTGGWAIESWYAEWEEICKGADNREKRAERADDLHRMAEKLEGFASKLSDRAWEYRQSVSEYESSIADSDPTGLAYKGTL